MVCRRPSLAPGTRSFLKMNTGLIPSVRVFPRQHRGCASMSLEDWGATFLSGRDASAGSVLVS